MIYLDLFLGFLFVGCFAFGGAYGAIPLIRDVVLGYGWLTDEALTYMIAVSESTPGPVMVNLATYVGGSQAGFTGAAVATLAVVLPSFVVILLVMTALENLSKNRYIQAVLSGLKPCVIGIVLATGVYMVFNNTLSITTGLAVEMQSIVLTIVLMAVVSGSRRIFKKKISPIMLIVVSAALGIFVYGI